MKTFNEYIAEAKMSPKETIEKNIAKLEKKIATKNTKVETLKNAIDRAKEARRIKNQPTQSPTEMKKAEELMNVRTELDKMDKELADLKKSLETA